MVQSIKRWLTAFLLLGLNCPLTACAPSSGSVDQAYYNSSFSLPGAYTRTIFTPSNF